jgi:membrane-associated phospholipid phosphatase
VEISCTLCREHPLRTFRLACLLLALLALSACSANPGGQKWSVAASRAALSPATWAPLAGAAVLAATDWDGQISDWASDRHPVFGSEEGAKTGSDILLATAGGLYGASALAAPQESLWERTTADAAALVATTAATEGLKIVTHRPRPDDSGNQSFPSLHTALGASFATLTANNLDFSDWTPKSRRASRAGLLGLTAATGWARIEAGEHYPSDVLVGAAIGHFFSVLCAPARDAGPVPARTTLSLSRKGTVLLGFRGSF